MTSDPLTPVPSEHLLGPGHGPGVWPLRERLALASALLDVDNQQATWPGISRKLLRFTRPGRPENWCSARACAKQYSLLLDSVELVRRQKIANTHAEFELTGKKSIPQTSGLCLAERVVKRLSAERVDELRTSLRKGQHYYSCLKKMITDLELGQYESDLETLWTALGSDNSTKLSNSSISSPTSSTICSESVLTGTSTNPVPTTNSQITEFLNIWYELDQFYRPPDSSTWAFTSGPNTNRSSGSNKCRPNGGSNLTSLNRLSTLIAEASQPSLTPSLTSRRNSNSNLNTFKHKSNLGESNLHGYSATTRAAEATKNRYLSSTSKHRITSRIPVKHGSGLKDKQHQQISLKFKRKSSNQFGSPSSSQTSERKSCSVSGRARRSQTKLSYDSPTTMETGSSISSLSRYGKDRDHFMDSDDDENASVQTTPSTPSTVAMCFSDLDECPSPRQEDQSSSRPDSEDMVILPQMDQEKDLQSGVKIPRQTEDAILTDQSDNSQISAGFAGQDQEMHSDTPAPDLDVAYVTDKPNLGNVCSEQTTPHTHPNQPSPSIPVPSLIEEVSSDFPVLQQSSPNPIIGDDLEGKITSYTCSNQEDIKTESLSDLTPSLEHLGDPDPDPEPNTICQSSPNLTKSSTALKEQIFDSPNKRDPNDNSTPKHSLRLRLSRKGSQLVVLPVPGFDSDHNLPTNDQPVRDLTPNTSLDSSLIHPNDWYAWARTLLTQAESIVLTDTNVRMQSPKQPISSDKLHELIDEIIGPIRQQLANQNISSRQGFIHSLLDRLARTVMIRPSNSDRYRIAQQIYHHLAPQLQLWIRESNWASPVSSQIDSMLSWTDRSSDSNPPLISHHP